MKKFINRILFFLLPIFIIAVILEFSIRQIPNDYSYKRKFLDSNSNNIEALFLGSSHTYFGVNPEFITGNTFNASHLSQSIDYDYAILKKYENDWRELKYIVIPIDYFTMFSRISTGVEKWRVKNYIIYYNINKEFNLIKSSEILSMSLRKSLKRIYYYLNGSSSIMCSKLGYGKSEYTEDLLTSGISAAKRHTKSDYTYFEKNSKILYELVEFSKKKQLEIIFYTSPAYHTYVSNLNKNQMDMTTNTINELLKNNSNCYYYNLLEDDSFDAQDFGDADHLNDRGAKKLSLRLNDIINEIR